MWRLAIFIPVMLALIGCGNNKTGTAVLSGTIKYKGQPVNGGSLMLYKTSGAGESITIPISQDGTFRSSDVPEGEYKAAVQPSAGFTPHMPKGGADKAENKSKAEAQSSPATIAIPEKYKKRTTTDLTVTVGKTDTKVDLELKD